MTINIVNFERQLCKTAVVFIHVEYVLLVILKAANFAGPLLCNRSVEAVYLAACALMAWCQMEQDAVSTRPAVHVCTMETHISLGRH